MEKAHSRALTALEPFIVVITNAKSPTPRFIAENISRATAAPGSYVFTELLQLPAVQSLKAADTASEYQAWLKHLEIFSYGTFEEYQTTPNLPALNDAQALKLRQLTLLTLSSSPKTPLTYANLLKALSLASPSDLENLITTSIYSDLITARLSPSSTPPTVHITSVAPLRDLRPMSIPSLLNILSTWSSRCDNVISDLESQIASIRHTATKRQKLAKQRKEILDEAVAESPADLAKRPDPYEISTGGAVKQVRTPATQGGIKRDHAESEEGANDADVYEADEYDEGGFVGEEAFGNGRMDADIDMVGTGVGIGNGGGGGMALHGVGGAGGGGNPMSNRGNKKSRGKMHWK